MFYVKYKQPTNQDPSLASGINNTFEAMFFEKNNDIIHFPATYSPQAQVNYKLRSIVVHEGIARGGHYVAYTYDDRHGWVLYNDADSPERVSEQTVLEQCPYMLFYERI